MCIRDRIEADNKAEDLDLVFQDEQITIRAKAKEQDLDLSLIHIFRGRSPAYPFGNPDWFGTGRRCIYFGRAKYRTSSEGQ